MRQLKWFKVNDNCFFAKSNNNIFRIYLDKPEQIMINNEFHNMKAVNLTEYL